MRARILPPSEWPKLNGTEAETLWPHLRPERSAVVVVEDGPTIVGCHTLLEVLHAECLWIAPEHRGRGVVARRLWESVKQTARARGFASVATAAVDDRIRDLLEHVGAVKLDGDHYVVRV